MIQQMVGNLNIASRLVALNHRFEETFDVSLWSRPPLKEIAEIDQPVTKRGCSRIKGYYLPDLARTLHLAIVNVQEKRLMFLSLS